MTSQYSQKIEIAISGKNKRTQMLGIVFKLLGLGMVLAAIFASYYIFFVVIALMAVGVVFTQKYYSATKEFEYDFNQTRLVVAKTNIINKRARIAEILFSDVVSYEYFSDVLCDDDICAVENPQSQGVKSLEFMHNETKMRLLIQPDDYLDALITETLAQLKREK